ncbi:NAD-dependent epimerase/dehydratase family protein [Halobellus sp. Atlit-38R]|uniref:NAD-dependent epimerase/dehydratase family protein n=1 Tax=Halobellus sp. Atlit-38R TaxID=2282131 RepID=UPI000EF21624|nr:NAD-dependent epimerase/dehydratase family protein [Halobellus sp. Atlit-38R]RLM83647.1 NAD-dependent epimerase/dehydratase family protein [Halobellus sp. Atlit-38R]
MLDSRRIAVTGAGGYIGSRVVREFLDAGADVVAIDDLSGHQISTFSNAQFVELDIRDEERLETALSDVDVVCHLAAISGIPDCESDPDRAFSVNVQGTENLAWYCRKHGIPLAFASSMAVIGEPVEFPIGAEHPRDPVSLYGLTKKMNEDDIHDLARSAFPAHLFLTANLYGTHEFGREEVTKQTVINIFVRRALDDEPLTVHRPGTQTFDFIHVKDVARAYRHSVSALLDEDNGAADIPLASGEQLSVTDVAELIQRVCQEERGYEPAIEYVEDPRESQPTGPDFTVDTATARERLGFETEHTVEETVRRALQQGES